MAEGTTQIWKSARLTIERSETETEGTVFRLHGPLTSQDIYYSLSPETFRKIFETAPGLGMPAIHAFDLSEVPYIDSQGLGMLTSHYAHCRNNGIQLSIRGLSPRVRDLFKITKMDTVLPIK